MELKSKTVRQYLLGTFLLSYVLWGIIIASNGKGFLAYGTPIGMTVFLLGGLAPTIVSSIVLTRNHEVSGLKQIIKDTFTFRQKPIVYATVFGFMGIIYLTQIIFGNVLNQAPFYYAILAFPVMLIGGGLEEVGWRYLLQPAFEKKLSFAVSTAIIGVIWAFWHLPLFYIEGSSQNLYMEFPVFAIGVFGSAFILALLRKIGVGIWPCVCFHCLNNALSVSFPIHEKLVPVIITNVITVLGVLIYYYVVQHKNKAEK